MKIKAYYNFGKETQQAETIEATRLVHARTNVDGDITLQYETGAGPFDIHDVAAEFFTFER